MYSERRRGQDNQYCISVRKVGLLKQAKFKFSFE